MTVTLHKTIELAAPLDFGGETIASVIVRKPKAKDLICFEENSSKSQIRGMLAMLASMNGKPPESLLNLEQDDLETVTKALEGFFTPPKRKGGAAPAST